MKRKICVITGTRSEYGLLNPLLTKLGREPCFELQLVATGTHLSPEFGLTYREIEENGFSIDRKVEILLSSNTAVGTAKSIGLAVIGFAEVLAQLRPDLLVLLGDRYEILSAAQAALVAGIPIAHIGGGDITEGAFEEAIRHSVTKMSHIHFVSDEESGQRVRQLGEDPKHIYNVGSLGIDRIFSLPLMSRAELEKSLCFLFREKNLLITFCLATPEPGESGGQFHELLAALHSLGDDVGLLFTKPNADPSAQEIIRQTEEFVSTHSNAAAFSSLGQKRYFNLITHMDAVVGNSSSGVYEVPSFHKPTVNIGDRQKGRLLASSVICCPPDQAEIEKAIWKALNKDCSQTVNPYGDGKSADKILDILKSVPDYKRLLKKHFYSVGNV